MAENKSKKYWKGIEELENTPEFRKSLESEFPEEASLDAFLKQAEESGSNFSRRSFLKATGFTVGAAILGACARGPVEKAIPLLNRAEIGVPGKAYWYASTCHGCVSGCGILVKNRDGRPIKIEGNPRHPLSQGGVCAVGQATVLSLYDSKRLQEPLFNGKPAEWKKIDRVINDRLNRTNENVYILTETITSPTTRYLIGQFLKRFKNSRHIEYDPVSCSAI
ncbi:MAG: TAT-variant-translocated molybdopterin oxidoreductase, partial [Calditrichaeota bacterium]|nr:TAT-variant-translocated molybdopterin oxidoreductase [Calditrichota bacterium]